MDHDRFFGKKRWKDSHENGQYIIDPGVDNDMGDQHPNEHAQPIIAETFLDRHRKFYHD